MTVVKTRGIPCFPIAKNLSSRSSVVIVGMTVIKTFGIGNSDRSVVKLTKSPSLVSNTSQNFMNTQLYHFLLPLPSVFYFSYIPFFVFCFPFFPFNTILANYNVLNQKTALPLLPPCPIIYPQTGSSTVYFVHGVPQCRSLGPCSYNV